MASSCFTPRDGKRDSHLEGALDAGVGSTYEPLISTVGFGKAPEVDANEKAAYELARRYLELTGADLTFDATIEDLMAVFKQELPKVPSEFFTEFKSKLDVSRAQDQVIRSTMKLYSEAELRALVAFFESSAGRAYLERRHDFVQDAARIGAELGRQVNDRLILELRRRNFMY